MKPSLRAMPFRATALLGAVLVLLAPGWPAHALQAPPPPPPGAVEEAPLLTPQQLDDLVAPIALYPDPLVAQILAAATYPLEVVEADRWLQANPGLQGTALTDAAQNQPWDPSVQALVVFPSVLGMLDRNLTWTINLGNAFLAQAQDVMDAIQRQRQRAMSSGTLASNQQQLVQQSTAANQTVIEILPAQPEVVYVPVYDPVAIWGAPVYHPWPPFWYPPRPVGAVIAAGCCRVLLRRRGRAELPSLGRLEWMGVGRGVASTHRRGEQHLLRPQQLPLAEQLHPQRTERVVARSTPPRWCGISLAWRGGPRRCPRGTHSPAGASAGGRGHGHHAAVSRRASTGDAAHPFRPGSRNGRATAAAHPVRPRPDRDRTMFGGSSVSGERARIESDRGHGSLGSRPSVRPAPTPQVRPAPAPPQGRPAPAPQGRPAPGGSPTRR